MARINLRLNKTDLDLQMLFTFHKAGKLIPELMRAYLHNEVFYIELPPESPVQRRVVQLSVTLEEPEDSELIHWYKSLKRGTATTVLKTLVRGYMVMPDLRPFETGEQRIMPKPAPKSSGLAPKRQSVKRPTSNAQRDQQKLPALPAVQNGNSASLDQTKPESQQQEKKDKKNPMDFI